jgi:hypothetical protein
MFGKKFINCDNCNTKVSNKFSFCPYCGNLLDEENNSGDYGLLGKDDDVSRMPIEDSGFGIADKLIGSLMNGLIKNLDKQFKQADRDFRGAEIKNFPSGIKISIGSAPVMQQKRQKKEGRTSPFQKQLSEGQIEKMSSLPRTEAKSKMKRMGNKIIYELDTPGIQSIQDIFLSKLESGYEIKAIAEKKVYVNSLQINLPLQKLSFNDNKLFLEFINPGQ